MSPDAAMHPEITDWSDHVRGVAGAERSRAMGEHLVAGCARCEMADAAMRRVADLALADRRLEPEPEVVRAVKDLFANRQPERARGLKCLALQLVYDSLLQSAPAGLRDPGAGPRRRVYRGESLALDLEITGSAGRDSDLLLAGELVGSSQGPMPDVEAQLVEEGAVIDQCRTGALGDFSITCERPETTRLRLLVGSGSFVEVSLGA